MEQTKYDVFISYSRKDTAMAEQICEALDRQGISHFIDRQGIGGGQDVPKVLAEAIVGCRIMLYLASENSYKSKYTSKEITFAFNEKPDGCILPYIIDGSCLPTEQRFLFASTNILKIEEHPIETVLVRDLCQLLGHKYRDVDKTNSQANTPQIINEDDFKEIMEMFNEGEVEIEALQNILKKQEDTKLKRVEKDGKWGFADESGNVVIPCRWDAVGSFSEGLARVQGSNRKWGFIDIAGKVVIPCEWKWAEQFSGGLARVVDEDAKRCFIDKTGKIIT